MSNRLNFILKYVRETYADLMDYEKIAILRIMADTTVIRGELSDDLYNYERKLIEDKKAEKK